MFARASFAAMVAVAGGVLVAGVKLNSGHGVNKIASGRALDAGQKLEWPVGGRVTPDSDVNVMVHAPFCVSAIPLLFANAIFAGHVVTGVAAPLGRLGHHLVQRGTRGTRRVGGNAEGGNGVFVAHDSSSVAIDASRILRFSHKRKQ